MEDSIQNPQSLLLQDDTSHLEVVGHPPCFWTLTLFLHLSMNEVAVIASGHHLDYVVLIPIYLDGAEGVVLLIVRVKACGALYYLHLG